METLGEIIPFAKEMLSQRPGGGMVKIYMLGTTLALFGVVVGLLETVSRPFVEQDTTEDREIDLIVEEEEEEEKEKEQTSKPQTAPVSTDEVLETTEIGAKAKPLLTARRRSIAS